MSKISGVLRKKVSQEAQKWIKKTKSLKTLEDYCAALEIDKKSDNSVVTKLDLFFSELTHEILAEQGLLKSNAFICEETFGKDAPISAPSYILDPIDGTREFVRAQREWCYSLAFMNSSLIADQRNEAWIFAPGLQQSLFSNDLELSQGYYQANPLPLLGLVSRSEWAKDIYKDFLRDEAFILAPKGSIALKLSYLASGACQFVFSSRSKHIWDIAGGSILCSKRGIKTYDANGVIEVFGSKVIRGPLLWCHEDSYTHLKKLFNVSKVK